MAWAQILLSTVVEIAAWHTGRVASRLPAVPLQALTRRLVLSALLLGASVRTAAVPPNLALASVEAPVFVAPVADVVSHASPAPTVHPTPSARVGRSEEHTSELQSLMRISYAVFCLKKKKN